MGSCISTKRFTKKRKSPVITCPPSFIYIPACQMPALPDTRRISGDNPLPTWSGITSTKKKRQPQRSGPDFQKIYRRSDIVDKRLFLNSCFIAPCEEMYSPNSSPTLLTPITPASYLHDRVIEATFTPASSAPGISPYPPGSADNISPLVTSSGYQTATGTMVSRATTAGSQITTFISEGEVFSFDETTINRFYSSSLKKEVLALF